MELDLYQIDAFTGEVFKGNPAAVCPLDEWLPDQVLQSIATENNLSETAFYVPEGDRFHIRWFTPASEVNLCGHATLASAYVLFTVLGISRDRIVFMSKSGELRVSRNSKDQLVMDFPAQPPKRCPCPEHLVRGLGKEPMELLCHDDYMAVFESEDDILSLSPKFDLLRLLDLRGVIVTAPGNTVDFISRFFVPKYDINEDPVTGSSHCELTPYWSERLGKKRLKAKQVSRRGGELVCELKKDRVFLTGRAVKYMEAKIHI
ncbi:MAG: PhzF family phenazine biosynthesis protein [Desulfobacterales bacterium]